MPSVFKVADQQKKKIKISERINPLTPLLLIYPIGNNHFSPIKARIKRIRTIKKVFGVMLGKNRMKAKIFLQ